MIEIAAKSHIKCIPGRLSSKVMPGNVKSRRTFDLESIQEKNEVSERNYEGEPHILARLTDSSIRHITVESRKKYI